MFIGRVWHGVQISRMLIGVLVVFMLFNSFGEEHDHVASICRLWGTRYESREGGIWSVSSNILNTVDLHLCSQHEEQLTGRPPNVRYHAIDTDVHGVVTTNLILAESFSTTKEFVDNSIRARVVRGKEFGLMLYEEDGELGVLYSFDAFGRVGLIENYYTNDFQNTWPIEYRLYNPVGDLIATEHVLDANDTRHVTLSRYDLFGNRCFATNSVGHWERATYDPFSRITSISGGATSANFEYDTMGRMIRLRTTRDGFSQDTTAWTYDPRTGLCLSKSYPDGTGNSFEYTPDGLLSRTIMARGWRRYEYDEFRHLCMAAFSENTTVGYRLENDPLGNVRSVYDSHGRSVLRSYNTRGMLVSETTSLTTTNNVVRSFDKYDRLNGIAHVRNGERIGESRFSYDASGCLETMTITNHAQTALAISYSNFAGKVQCTSIRAERLLRERNNWNAYRRELIDASEWLCDNSVLATRTNFYDKAGRIARSNGDDYSYDARNQFLSGSVAGCLCSNAYDQAGNVVRIRVGTNSWALGKNSLNQTTVLSDGQNEQLCRYDGDGNLVYDGKLIYGWDLENRLLSVTPVMPVENDLAISNVYDYLGRRVEKVVHCYHQGSWDLDRTVEMVYDGRNLVFERRVDSDGHVDELEFFWGAQPHDRHIVAGGVGALVAVSVNGSFFIPVYDANWNIVGYLNENGVMVVSRVFSPTGIVLSESGADAALFPFGFGTKYHDREEGVIHYENRCYCPWMASWMSRDPAQENGGLNLYCFAENRFCYGGDTSGMFGWTSIAVALIEGVGLVLDRTPVSNMVDDSIIDSYGGPEGFMNATERELASRGGALPRDLFAKARAKNSKAITPDAKGLEGTFHGQLQSAIRASRLYSQKKEFIIGRLKAGTAHVGFVNIDFQDAGETTLGYAIGGAQLHYKYNESDCSVSFSLKDKYDFTGKGHMWGRLERRGFLTTYDVNVEIEAVKGVKAK